MNKKYIWTFWTEAWKEIKPWDLLCYAVSIGFVKRLSDNLVVYTDSNGADLIKDFNLNVEYEILNFELGKNDSNKYAMAKLKTMAIQEEPFIHIDHDVFLLKEQKHFPEASISAQSLERGKYEINYFSAYYRTKEQNITIPNEIERCAENNEFYGYNCGYVDVNDVQTSKKWCNRSLEFAEKFIPFTGSDPIITEQMTLYAFSKYWPFNVSCLFDETSFNQLGPEMAGYVHLMGGKTENRDYVTSRLLFRAKQVAPDFYKKCFSHLD